MQSEVLDFSPPGPLKISPFLRAPRKTTESSQITYGGYSPLVKDRLSVLSSEQVMPGGGLVLPEVGEDALLGPGPTMIPHPKPQAARTVGMGVGPAELHVIDPSALMGKEGSEPW